MASVTKILIALAALLLIAYMVWARPNALLPAIGRASASGSIEQRLDELLLAQQAQAEELAFLRARLASPGDSGSKLKFASAGIGAEHDHKETTLTPEQLNEKLRGTVNQMDSEFLSEPVTSGWAGTTEKKIFNAFSEKNLATHGAPAPRAHEASCRSFTCRIHVTYADAVEADIGQQFLLVDIAERLPRSKLIRMVQPDGSVALIMYANTGRARR